MTGIDCSTSNPSYRTYCTFNCKTGYQAKSGSKIRTCKSNGMWSGDELVCERKSSYAFYVVSLRNLEQHTKVSICTNRSNTESSSRVKMKHRNRKSTNILVRRKRFSTCYNQIFFENLGTCATFGSLL